MSPRETPAARPELDVALFDFADEHGRDPERSLYRLQFLLLDEDTCLARVAFLQSLAAAADQETAPPDVRSGGDRFREEIDLITEEGLFAVHAAGHLTADWIDRLDALTRDPDALLEARRRLVQEEGEMPDPGRDTGLGSGTSVSLTRLALDPPRWPDLLRLLRPWLPVVLGRGGLETAHADALLAFIEGRLPQLGNRSFRRALPEWVAEFARERELLDRSRPLPAEVDLAVVDEWSLDMTLGRADPDEPALSKELRAFAAKQQLRSSDELLGLVPPGRADDSELPEARSRLFFEAQGRLEEGLVLFDCK